MRLEDINWDEEEEQAEESMLGQVQSEFDGAGQSYIRETNPLQQYFDFGEQLNPRLDKLDQMSGYRPDTADDRKEE